MITNVQRLLIVKTSSIGDVVHALPVAQIIKEHHQSIEIGWVVRKRCADVLSGNSYIDRVYEIDDKPSLQALSTLARNLRSQRYDMAWDMQGLSLSGLVTCLSGAPRRVGLDLNREMNRWFLTEPVVPARSDRHRHAIAILRGFLPTLGISPDAEWPPLCYLADDVPIPPHFARLAHNGRKTAAALNIGASSIYKQWPAQSWAALVERIVGSEQIPVLVGGVQDMTMADAIRAACAAGAWSEAVDLVGRTTLRQTAHALNECALLVTGDTGPMHVAAALRVPVVALFGPTDPVKTGPYATESIVIKHNDCCTLNHRRPTCNGEVRCMRGISVDEVYSAMQRVSKEPAQRC